MIVASFLNILCPRSVFLFSCISVPLTATACYFATELKLGENILRLRERQLYGNQSDLCFFLLAIIMTATLMFSIFLEKQFISASPQTRTMNRRMRKVQMLTSGYRLLGSLLSSMNAHQDCYSKIRKLCKY